MIAKFDKPEYMTKKQAEDRFHPNAFIMINCDVEYHAPVAGYVVAAETVGIEDYPELSAYYHELNSDSANGKIYVISTDDPLKGEGLYIEYLGACE